MRTLAMLAAAAAATAAPVPAPSPSPAPAPAPVAPPAKAAPRPLAYAEELAELPMVHGPLDWKTLGSDAGWPMLARAKGTARQRARWAYAAQLIGRDHAAEADGVLMVMLAGDPDLVHVPSFQLARGAVLARLDRPREALEAMSTLQLIANPEACMWRARAFARLGKVAEAVRQTNCAVPAINARPGAARRPFILTGARAAIDVGRPQIAQQWLKALSDSDPQANLLRARIAAAAGKLPEALKRLGSVDKSRDPAARAEARLVRADAMLAAGKLAPKDAFAKLDAIGFAWRGDDVEKHALELSYRLAQQQNDVVRALHAGSTLVRYFDMAERAAPLLAELRQMLLTALAPDSKVKLSDAASIYWEYRDLAPPGPDGDLLALRLADRLQVAGLPGRAAELTEYQLKRSAEDVTRGPLSIKVALLHILAGHPDRALDALRTTEDPNYTEDMRWDRKRMEAVALFQLGRQQAAQAALEDVPGAALVRAEMAWKAQDWPGVIENASVLPAPKALDAAGQTQVLRHAVALAMLNREPALKALRARYAPAFKGLPSAGAFEVLTRDIAQVDPGSIEKALNAIPSASPAGGIGDLLEIRPKK